jgi:hypothetical protein
MKSTRNSAEHDGSIGLDTFKLSRYLLVKVLPLFGGQGIIYVQAKPGVNPYGAKKLKLLKLPICSPAIGGFERCQTNAWCCLAKARRPHV